MTTTLVFGRSPRLSSSGSGAHPLDSRALAAYLLHDQACQDQTRPWREVHRELYPMLRCHGVGWLRADLITRAVEWFGPGSLWRRAWSGAFRGKRGG